MKKTDQRNDNATGIQERVDDESKNEEKDTSHE